MMIRSMNCERVERDLGRHRRQAEADHPPQQLAVGHAATSRRRSAKIEPEHERDARRGSCRAAGPRAPSSKPTTSSTVSGIASEDVADREREVRLRPLVEPEQGDQVLVERQHPEAADRDPDQVGSSARRSSRSRDLARRTAARSARRRSSPRSSAAKPVATTSSPPRRAGRRSAAAPRSARGG